MKASLRNVILGIGFACLITLPLLNWAFPPNLARLQDNSVIVYDCEHQPLHVFCSRQQQLWCLPVTCQEVDPNFMKHVVAIEDKRFWSHYGVDGFALARAVYQAIRHGHIISGGSTITMQTVRLLEPRPRTVTSKLTEMLRSWQLEWHFSKEQIMGMYLTLAPYGGNISGIKAASHTYFNHGPERLTPAESALLVALPRSPTKLRPDIAPQKVRRVRNKILSHLYQQGDLAEVEWRDAKVQPIAPKRYRFPRRIPHLARRLILAHPNVHDHHTFIDSALQSAVESIVSAAIIPHSSTNIAVMVVDQQTNQVCAYVGSRNFLSRKGCGQVDFTQGIRSPGSTLKPFIYGLGFDAGLIHPDTVLKDAPAHYGTYSPTNFDHLFRGELTVRQALKLSLNLPVVTVLNHLGSMHFVSTLQQSGIKMRLPHPETGVNLSMSLGGVGMNLEELVLLYNCLAHGGEVFPLKYSQDLCFGKNCNLLSAQSAQQIKSILTLGENYAPLSAKVQQDFAVKTGTSYGYRDAWALGVGGRYTVGVWLGCPDGTSMRGSTGNSIGVPILKKIFQVLPQGAHHPIVTYATHRTIVPYQLHPGVSQAQIGQTNLNEDRFAVTFPIDGTVVQLQRDEQGQRLSISLITEGGDGEIEWLVNDRPIVLQKERHRTLWLPPAPGFYALTAVDREGKQSRVVVEVQE